MRQQNSGAVEDFCSPVFGNFSTNPKVKELLKSVHICQSCRKNKSGSYLLFYILHLLRIKVLYMAHSVFIGWARKVSLFTVVEHR